MGRGLLTTYLAVLFGLLLTVLPASAHAGIEDDPRWQGILWEWQQRVFPGVGIPAGARERAKRTIDALDGAARGGQRSGGGWMPIGPAPILSGQVEGGGRPVSGRVTDIAIDPTDANHWLVAAASGGVWSTADAGGTWTPRTDVQASLAMGAVAFAPSNPAVIYAGTGEGNFSIDSFGGAGILKSSDGGVTWTLQATSLAHTSIAALRVDPANVDVVVAAAGSGIYRTTDGGNSWSSRLSGDGTSLVVDPTSFSRQYAGLGSIWGDAANGVYRSTDGGLSWTVVTGPWTSLAAGIGRVAIAVAPSNPSVAYVSMSDAFNGNGNDGSALGLWKTTNAWAPTPTWSAISIDPVPGIGETASWYNMLLSVDPTNPDFIFIGGDGVWSWDGTSWTEHTSGTGVGTGVHVDQHAGAWVGTRFVLGNDGGVWSTTDHGATWSDHNTNLATIQYYAGSLDPTNVQRAMGGSQDNGTSRWTGNVAWDLVYGGDGATSAISAANPTTSWAASYQGLAIIRTTDGGASWSAADGGIDTINRPFIGYFVECPANSDVMIAGTDNVWRTNAFFSSGMPSWTANGPDLPAKISALAFAPSDATCATYAVGTENGDLRLTTDGGVTWTDIDASDVVPGRHVSDLAFDPTNAATLFVALSGFDANTPGHTGHVFKTTSATSPSPTWTNVSPPVDLPHNAVAVADTAPFSVYVGTDLGVWRSADGGAHWIPLGPATGMPNAVVYRLAVYPGTHRVVAFTHGRSAFALDDTAVCGNGTVDLGEQCDDGNTMSGDGCSASCSLETGCAAVPDPGCRAPFASRAATLSIKNKSPDLRDQVSFKAGHEPSSTIADFGDPATSTGYALCVYGGNTLVLNLGAPGGATCGGGPCWKAIGSGWKYRSKDGLPDGVTGIKLTAGSGVGAVSLRARGSLLGLPSQAYSVPVHVQIQAQNGECWGATFSSPSYDTAGDFSGRSD